MIQFYLPVGSRLWNEEVLPAIARYAPVYKVERSPTGNGLIKRRVDPEKMRNPVYLQNKGYSLGTRTLLSAQYTGGLFGIDWNPMDSPYWKTVSGTVDSLLPGVGSVITGTIAAAGGLFDALISAGVSPSAAQATVDKVKEGQDQAHALSEALAEERRKGRIEEMNREANERGRNWVPGIPNVVTGVAGAGVAYLLLRNLL